jgi:stage II sporulation protein M
MSYKLWIIVAAGLFVIGLGTGLIIIAVMPANIVGLLSEKIAPVLEELVADLRPFQANTAVFIFFQNARTLLISFIFSPILCLLPIMALLVNGSLLSFLSAFVAQEKSLGLVLAALLPHGILEISAIIIGEAAALSFGATTIMALFSKKKIPLLPNFKQNLKYLLLAFVILIPAAIIETFITPLFLQ